MNAAPLVAPMFDPVFDRLTRIVAEQAGIPVHTAIGSLSPATVIRDLDLDSLDAIELVTAIEDHFAVTITDDEWAAAITLEQLILLVDAKLSAQTAALQDGGRDGGRDGRQ